MPMPALSVVQALEGSPGMLIHDAADRAIEYLGLFGGDVRYVWLIFNGVAMRVVREDTIDTIVADYQGQLQTRS